MDSNLNIGTLKNPIKCDGVIGEIKYLESLITFDNLPILYKRNGSISNGKGVILDKYEIFNLNMEYITELYFNMYNPNYIEKEIIDGFLNKENTLKYDNTYDIDILEDIKIKIYGNNKKSLSKNYIYLWSLSKYLLQNIYNTSIPLTSELSSNGKIPPPLIKIVTQIYYELKGESEQNPILTKDHVLIQKFIKSFNFKYHSCEEIKTKLNRYTVKHIITKEEIILYFKFM